MGWRGAKRTISRRSIGRKHFPAAVELAASCGSYLNLDAGDRPDRARKVFFACNNELGVEPRTLRSLRVCGARHQWILPGPIASRGDGHKADEGEGKYDHDKHVSAKAIRLLHGRLISQA